MAETVPFKYRAFLSYSHRDTRWAKWLHGALEGYRIDKELVGRATAQGPIPKALRPIFRDRNDFTTGHSLNEETLAALDASAALIVLCSPAAVASRYVEVALFRERHPQAAGDPRHRRRRAGRSRARMLSARAARAVARWQYGRERGRERRARCPRTGLWPPTRARAGTAASLRSPESQRGSSPRCRDRPSPTARQWRGCRGRISVSYGMIGDVLVAQGNLPEALKSFRDSLAIAERAVRRPLVRAGYRGGVW